MAQGRKGDGSFTMIHALLASDFMHSKQVAEWRGFRAPGEENQGSKGIYDLLWQIDNRPNRSITREQVKTFISLRYLYCGWYRNGGQKHEKFIPIPVKLANKGVVDP